MKQRKLRISIIAAAYCSAAISVHAYSPHVVGAIHIALDDEYKAHSTYAAYLAHFGKAKPFSNIIRSEERHIEALKNLLTSSGAEIPVNPYKVSEIEIPENVTEACKIGIKAEEENARLYYNQLLPIVKDHEEIVSVFKNLADASQRKHLQAFKRCASRK